MKSDWAYASPKKGKMKKGELTTQQIVMLIVLITSFAILLFFLFRLNIGEEADKELCRNSVLLKGKSVFKDSASLNCKRSYVCLTADGSCEYSESVEANKKEEVYQILADEMAECWWMFGEGKVNYIGEDLTRNNYCSICSQLSFDDSLIDSVKEFGETGINKKEFYIFLGENNVPGKEITYLDYLYGIKGVKGIEEIEKTLIEQGSGFGTINLGNPQFVMMGIRSKVSDAEWIVGGAVAGAVLVAGFLAAPFTFGASVPVSIGLISVGAVAGATGGSLTAITVEGVSGDEDFLAPTIIGANSKEFTALNCKEVVTLS